MPWAKDDTLSQDPLEGGIEISDAQYAQALQAKIEGWETLVINGLLVIRLPSPGPWYVWRDGAWILDPAAVALDGLKTARLGEVDLRVADLLVAANALKVAILAAETEAAVTAIDIAAALPLPPRN